MDDINLVFPCMEQFMGLTREEYRAKMIEIFPGILDKALDEYFRYH